jgi:hypothetical protein
MSCREAIEGGTEKAASTAVARRRVSAVRMPSATKRSLPSTGITRLRRYYEPLRNPRAPGLSLAGIRLVIADHAMGLPAAATGDEGAALRAADAGEMVPLSHRGGRGRRQENRASEHY